MEEETRKLLGIVNGSGIVMGSFGMSAHTEADPISDAEHKTLTVCLHHLTQAAHDQARVRLNRV
jgi:hypothetical protein